MEKKNGEKNRKLETLGSGGLNQTPNKLRVRKPLGCLAKVGPLSGNARASSERRSFAALPQDVKPTASARKVSIAN